MAASIGRTRVWRTCNFCGIAHPLKLTIRELSRRFVANVTNKGSKASSDGKIARDVADGWHSVIGLEIHAQIKSESKLFSGAGTQYGASTNTQVSFFDASLPGTLPVLNRKCVEAGVLTALALGCDINMKSKFDRKHYFYADMPAGYQITQQRAPLAVNGQLIYVYQCSRTSQVERRCARISQIQLEQDSGKSLHDMEQKVSLIDLNRAGIGLMEIVTAPDFTSGDDASSFVRDLRDILVSLGSCDGKMAEGSLRVDANISVHRSGEPWGTRTEVKNLNSFKSIRLAVDYEVERQINVLEAGGVIENETLSFDVENGETVEMRDKEKILDYRFMPEPNLLPLVLYKDRASVPPALRNHNIVVLEDLSERMIPMPDEKRQHLETAYNVPLLHSVTLVRLELSDLFESLVADYGCDSRATSLVLRNFYVSFLDDAGLDISESPFNKASLAEMIQFLEREEISGSTFTTLLREKAANPERSCVDIIEDLGLWMVNDQALITVAIDDVLSRNPKIVKAYRKGKTNQLDILRLKVAKKLEGKADSSKLQQQIKEKLEQS